MAKQKKYAMIIDTKRCVGCTACVITCKSENDVPTGYCRDWIDQIIEGNFPKLSLINRSVRCQHCEDAPCVANCPTGASHYPGDGTVIVDRSKCTGCKACIAACPYDARYAHPVGFVDKCSFCRHRLEKGLTTTACTSICPTNALTLVDMNSSDGIAKGLMDGRKVVQDKVHAGTHPKLYWLL